MWFGFGELFLFWGFLVEMLPLSVRFAYLPYQPQCISNLQLAPLLLWGLLLEQLYLGFARVPRVLHLCARRGVTSDIFILKPEHTRRV